MTMTPRLRKFALTAHVIFSVGWLGAVVAYLAVAVAGLSRQDAQMVRAAYLAMEVIGWFVIVPCSVAALLTGLVQSLGTEWGLFRHYWILVKFLLTIGATTILLLHMPAVSRVSGVAAEPTLSNADLGALRHPSFVVHAGGGLLVLLATTTLSVYKPWGMTRYGQRKQRKLSQSIPPRRLTTTRNSTDTPDLPSPPDSNDAAGVEPGRGSTTTTRWGLYVLLGVLGLVLLMIVLHLAGGGPRGH